MLKDPGAILPTLSPRNFLFDLEKFGMKMDLRNIQSLMEFAGNPQKNFKVIHVAGTNGKGSTCAAIASVMGAMGNKVGLYTSPHIIDFTERIKIGNEPISESELSRLTEMFEPEIVRLNATFFEATTAIMFKYFADCEIDFAVVETGLGGRLDSTNIVDPLISVVTSIGLDHTEILGETLEKIAFEKAGIMKPGRPAVINVSAPSVKDVFKSVAARLNAELYFVDEVANYEELRLDVDSTIFSAKVLSESYPGIRFGMVGRHQMQNALTALTTLEILDRHGTHIETGGLYQGLKNVSKNTGHRGRLERISLNPLVVLDVAHNPEGVGAVLESLGVFGDRRGIVLFAAMRDKDASLMLDMLRQRFEVIILTQLRTPRSLNFAELKMLSETIKLKAHIFDNSSEALRTALTQINNDSFLLIIGSHYLAGEILPQLEEAFVNPSA